LAAQSEIFTQIEWLFSYSHATKTVLSKMQYAVV